MTHLLFDLDGTILDTTELIMQSFFHAFREGLGEEVSRAELMEHFGRPLEAQFRLMRPALSNADVVRLIDIYRQHNHREHDGWVSVIPGASEVLRELARDHQMAIVTSKRLDMAERGLRQFGLWDLFTVVVHMESTPQHKPHPAPVEKALKALGASPAESLMIGDSPYDMASGRDAGCHTLGFLYNTFTEQALKDAGADRVVSSWEGIKLAVLARDTAVC